jgi:hypothetical protein
VLPAVAVQGLFELSETQDGSPEGEAWLARLNAGCEFLVATS